ncbi:hypothetical protein CEQ30_26790 [Nocardia brasiliensis]|nr:hypothetical protein CEQ30_26790 [Nocardia brasiliensis]
MNLITNRKVPVGAVPAEAAMRPMLPGGSFHDVPGRSRAMTDPAVTFALVPDEVTDAGRYVQQAAANLIAGLRSGSVEVDGLMTTWHGPAATAYAAAWDETHRAALSVFEALADMAELLGVVVDRSQATDTGTATAVSSLDLP